METSEFSLAASIQAVRTRLSTSQSAELNLVCLVDSSLPDHVISDQARLENLLESLSLLASRLFHSQHVRLTVHPGRESQPELDITFEFAPEHKLASGSDGQLRPLPSLDADLPGVRKAAQALGGEVGVQMQPHSGLLIWCRIPVQLEEKQRKSRERASTPGQRGEAKYPVKILMAEDNSINQRVGKLILQRAGYKIDLVSDGSEALEAHRSNPYDLILMDCQMPTMDGFEATRHIRSAGVRQPVIIAVTANALVGERERCLAAGMDDYLSKPFQAEQLVAMVEKWAPESLRRS